MALLAVSVVILCWFSVTLAAPLACEELIRPLDQLQPHRLVGRWALVAGSLSHLPFLKRFKQRESASIHFPTLVASVWETTAFIHHATSPWRAAASPTTGRTRATSAPALSTRLVATACWCARMWSQGSASTFTCSAGGGGWNRRKWRSSRFRCDVWTCLHPLWWIPRSSFVQETDDDPEVPDDEKRGAQFNDH